jgi:hypothetical protein
MKKGVVSSATLQVETVGYRHCVVDLVGAQASVKVEKAHRSRVVRLHAAILRSSVPLN